MTNCVDLKAIALLTLSLPFTIALRQLALCGIAIANTLCTGDEITRLLGLIFVLLVFLSQMPVSLYSLKRTGILDSELLL
jgi:hypothetical protein